MSHRASHRVSHRMGPASVLMLWVLARCDALRRRIPNPGLHRAVDVNASLMVDIARGCSIVGLDFEDEFNGEAALEPGHPEAGIKIDEPDHPRPSPEDMVRGVTSRWSAWMSHARKTSDWGLVGWEGRLVGKVDLSSGVGAPRVYPPSLSLPPVRARC